MMKSIFWQAMSALLALQGVARAQGQWIQVAATGPPARIGHAMVYDLHRGRTLLFGGTDYVSYFADTWEWNGATWIPQILASGPVGRYLHGMAYDSTRGRVVMFGGFSNGVGGVTALGDTWEWNGTAWANLSAAGGPSPRAHAALAFDSRRGRTVMFGGNGVAYQGDTWEWDGATWTLRSTTGPSARIQHAMAYDSVRGRTVLFGGQDGGPSNGDTWEWDGANWTLVSVAGPTRVGHCMTFDSQRQRTVLFGGIGAGGTSIWLDDTWEWDGASWLQVGTVEPTGRAWAAIAYDSQRATTVIFAGQRGGALGDTWERFGLPAGAATPYGAGCGNPALALAPLSGSLPLLGGTASASVTHTPSTITFVSIGWSRSHIGPFALPLPLAGYGMPGCDLLQSCELGAQPTTPAGSMQAVYSLTIPNWQGLCGMHFYLQGWASNPGANPGGVIVSNGLDWTIGY